MSSNILLIDYSHDQAVPLPTLIHTHPKTWDVPSGHCLWCCVYVPSEHKETQHCEGDWAVAQVAKRDVGVSVVGDSQEAKA